MTRAVLRQGDHLRLLRFTWLRFRRSGDSAASKMRTSSVAGLSAAANSGGFIAAEAWRPSVPDLKVPDRVACMVAPEAQSLIRYRAFRICVIVPGSVNFRQMI